MQLSAAGSELLKRSEGFRSCAYMDVAGCPTIGYGHRILASETFLGGIQETEAAALLCADVQVAERAVERLVRVALTQGQFDALVDFVFNLGAGRLAASTLLRDLNAGEHDAAGEQLLHWDLAAGAVNAGLKTRREAEFALWGSAGRSQAAAVPGAGSSHSELPCDPRAIAVESGLRADPTDSRKISSKRAL